MAKFTVDTHLFRELGELLVGRDSTALVELIKNAYDADATKVTVEGSSLDNPREGKIVITDNGIGMPPDIFENGFLRIASRIREKGERRSAKFERRFTGAKGVGRLAAHKLARTLQITSVPDQEIFNSTLSVNAMIDWDEIEKFTTIDEIEETAAIVLNYPKVSSKARAGTTIELIRLRRKWTPEERARFFWEVQTFRPPNVLLNIPDKFFRNDLLLSDVQVADSGSRDPGFDVTLTGDFEAGEEYWQALSHVAKWLIEIDARKERKGKKVHILISPTMQCLKEHPEAQAIPFTIDYPSESDGPYFQARILVREGAVEGVGRPTRMWLGRMNGIRVYMEGFRVLPYGEANDDWLGLDAGYKKRQRTLGYLENIEESIVGRGDKDEGLSFLGNQSYFGAAFLTHDKAADLRMIVNREGFIPNAAFDTMKKILRIGTDLSVRVRASVTHLKREERSKLRKQKAAEEVARDSTATLRLRKAVDSAVEKAAVLARRAREEAVAGHIEEATAFVERAASEFKSGADLGERLLTEPSMTRILAAIGLQMAAFVHEINSLLGMARSVEQAIERIRESHDLSRNSRKMLGIIASRIGNLRRAVERQASYLTDITSPDARRRRSRQVIAERFEVAAKLVAPSVERTGITIVNDIPAKLRTLPMFPAELTLIFSNLLTNAVKAAGENGRIRATAYEEDNQLIFRIENTGVEVNVVNAERWFRPFESTTEKLDPYLGQGMGMGLPITRNMLEEYGAEIRFAKPSKGFSTALQISFPERG